MKALLYLIFPAVLLAGYGKSWDQQYEEWIKNPEPYGGLKVLEKIKKVKDSGAKEIILKYSNISDISPLAGLTNLKELNLWANKISDLTPLAGFTNLRNLELVDNKISDLTPLVGLTNLKILHLSKNNISDLTPLAGLINLEVLSSRNNNISDLSPLAGLTNLKQLWLGSTPITASQKAMLKASLPNTDISW